ncbi:MAG TPA: hypothetical protein VGG34_06240 [Opitutaceae bacterium]|jgi:hypothetical protein
MNHRALQVIAALAAAACARAADPPPPAPTPTPTPPADAAQLLLTPKQQPAPVVQAAPDSDNVRPVSAGIAAALSEGLPKFTPPTPTPTPEPEDKPKNGIIRLPEYIVHEKPPPIFRKRDIFTQQSLIDLEFKAHPGLYVGNILGLNSAAAEQMREDEERQDDMGDLNDLAHAMSAGGDRAESQYILKESDDTYMRGSNWDWSGGGPVGPK